MKHPETSLTSTPNGFAIVVEDDPISAKLVFEFLQQQDVGAISCRTIEEAKLQIRKHPNVGALIVDIGLPDGDGIDFMRSVRRALPLIPCLILTARNEAQSAVLAMKAGASDYITKPFPPEALMAFVTGPMQVYRHQTKIEIESRNSRPQQIRWKSPVMLRSLQAAWSAAGSESPVLLLGACSTGKSAFAEFIHQNSTRSDQRLLTVDAASLRPDQMINGLFGPLSDGRTIGERRNGRLCSNDSGSIYLENVDHLAPHAQAAMVAWYERELLRMERNLPSPRLITSSCRDLAKAVREGDFREDLWYFLSVFQITIPEIHDRLEDIPLLCEQFITKICVARKLRRPTLTRQAMEILTRYNWPGNLSELHNVLEHAVSRTQDGLIGARDLPPLRASNLPAREEPARNNGYGKSSIEEITKASLIATLENCGGNRRMAAQQLKVSLRTVYNMIQRYELPGKRRPRTHDPE